MIPEFGNEELSNEATFLMKLPESEIETELKRKLASAFMEGGSNNGGNLRIQQLGKPN